MLRLLPHNSQSTTVSYTIYYSDWVLTVLDSPRASCTRYAFVSKIEGHLMNKFPPATARSALVGPVAGADYTYRDQFDLTSTVQSPCGADTVLNLNTELRVSNSANSTGSGYIANDSVSFFVSSPP